MLRAIVIAAVCWCSGAFAVANERPSYASRLVHGPAVSSRFTGTAEAALRAPRLKANAVRMPAADRDPYADPASSYKANRLAWSRGTPILNVPGQTTVLTRQVLDDMNATSLRDALRSTAGVTVGR
jgi:outer membrane receptor for monomeric catechols